MRGGGEGSSRNGAAGGGEGVDEAANVESAAAAAAAPPPAPPHTAPSHSANTLHGSVAGSPRRRRGSHVVDAGPLSYLPTQVEPAAAAAEVDAPAHDVPVQPARSQAPTAELMEVGSSVVLPVVRVDGNVCIVPGDEVPFNRVGPSNRHALQRAVQLSVRRDEEYSPPRVFILSTIYDEITDRGAIDYPVVGNVGWVRSVGLAQAPLGQREPVIASAVVKATQQARICTFSGVNSAEGRHWPEVLVRILADVEPQLPRPLPAVSKGAAVDFGRRACSRAPRPSVDGCGAGGAGCAVSSLPRTKRSRFGPATLRGGALGACSYWPRWVWDLYDPKSLADTAQRMCVAANLIQDDDEDTSDVGGVTSPTTGDAGGVSPSGVAWERSRTHRAEEEGRDDIVAFSHRIAHNVAITNSQRRLIMSAKTASQRLRMSIAMLREMKKRRALLCRVCGAYVASCADIFSGMERGAMGTFVNPYGIVHQVITVKETTGLELQHPAETAGSWFPGYAWNIASCRRCSYHMGWRYTLVDDRSAVFAEAGDGTSLECFWGLLPASVRQGQAAAADSDGEGSDEGSEDGHAD